MEDARRRVGWTTDLKLQWQPGPMLEAADWVEASGGQTRHLARAWTRLWHPSSNVVGLAKEVAPAGCRRHAEVAWLPLRWVV